jgi:hypothetical protein
MEIVQSANLRLGGACAEGRGGVRGNRVGHPLCGKRVAAVMISNQQRVRVSAEIPGGGSSKPRGSASRQRKPVKS